MQFERCERCFNSFSVEEIIIGMSRQTKTGLFYNHPIKKLYLCETCIEKLNKFCENIYKEDI